jgi:hypothetical protein
MSGHDAVTAVAGVAYVFGNFLSSPPPKGGGERGERRLEPSKDKETGTGAGALETTGEKGVSVGGGGAGRGGGARGRAGVGVQLEKQDHGALLLGRSARVSWCASLGVLPSV